MAAKKELDITITSLVFMAMYNEVMRLIEIVSDCVVVVIMMRRVVRVVRRSHYYYY